MSIELRIRDDHIECDWGVIEHTDPRPAEGKVGHLMLAPGWMIGGLLNAGQPVPDPRYGMISATASGRRLFAHIDDHAGKHWTWELFAADWEDGEGPDGMLIGRWPD